MKHSSTSTEEVTTMYTDDISDTEHSNTTDNQRSPIESHSRTEYCTNCAAPMDPTASSCARCRVARLAASQNCWHCASPISGDQALCLTCGAGLHGDSGRAGSNGTVQSKRIVAAALAFFCGALGIHRFYLGDTTGGLIRMGITVILGIVTLGLALGAMMVIAMIEAVIYVTHSDADFIRIYQEGDRSWF